MPRNIERDEKEAMRRKEQLMETGFRLFSQYGIENVSLQRVADAAEVGVATLYNYYQTKVKLVIAISGKIWGDLWKEITEEGRDSLDGAWEKLAQRQETCETKSIIAPTAPIIEDGKTLDELIAPNDAIGQYLLRTMRADGATDQEIWQFFLDT